jgi:hypothetical protein
MIIKTRACACYDTPDTPLLPGALSPGPAQKRPRTPGHLPGSCHLQREPVLPGHPQNAAAAHPLPPGAAPADTTAHNQQTAELARHKLGFHTSEDTDGYRRHTCPATAGKIRCPLRPASMKLDRNRPEILTRRRTRKPAAPTRPSPSRRRSPPGPGRNTTTVRAENPVHGADQQSCSHGVRR